MRALRALVAALLAAFSLTVLAPSPAFACSCAALTTAESVAGSDAVLLGTIDDVVGTDQRGAEVYTVRVDEVFAGMLPSTVSVSGSPEPCLTSLMPGEQYVVFATSAGDDEWTTDRCSGTTTATPALVDEVESLAGAGRPPYDVPGGLPDDTAPQGIRLPGPWPLTVAAAVLAFGMLAAFAGVVAWKANRRTD